jgi:hypothetical protein
MTNALTEPVSARYEKAVIDREGPWNDGWVGVRQHGPRRLGEVGGANGGGGVRGPVEADRSSNG